ncbi:hypothetical protein DY000_02040000 [Brassica cretica]|uniref:Uncharacterized protein n=1 Tax=Brassica cretica TaxID=69181 RepID=A0ABQ7BD09_BRACR|nr:hypothetical protein DY000_02040000 [Brassica cretica]
MEPAGDTLALNWPKVVVAFPSICGYIANTLSPCRCFFWFSLRPASDSKITSWGLRRWSSYSLEDGQSLERLPDSNK